MEDPTKTLARFFASSLKCEECQRKISYSKRDFHYQYCDASQYFSTPKYSMLNFTDKINFEKLQVFFDKLTLSYHFYKKINQKEPILSFPGGQEMHSRTIEKIFNDVKKIVSRKTFKSHQLKTLQSLIIFDIFQELNKDLYSIYSTFKRFGKIFFDIQKLSPNAEALEYCLGSCLDMKLDLKTCHLTEDGSFLVLSDKNKIIVYNMKSDKFICRINDPKVPFVGLASHHPYLIYQNIKNQLIVFNLRNKQKESKVMITNQDTVKYFKVSPDSKCLAVKFESHKLFLARLEGNQIHFFNTNRFNENVIFEARLPSMYIFDKGIDLYSFESFQKEKKIHRNNLKIEFLVLVDSRRSIIFSDKDKLKIIDLDSLNVTRQLLGKSDMFYISKDYKFLCDISGFGFKIRTVDENVVSFRNLREKDRFECLNHSAFNIFLEKKLKLKKNSPEGFLQRVVDEKKFIQDEKYSELLVLNEGVLNKIYWKKKKKVIFSWLVSDPAQFCKNEINLLGNFRYYNNDYLVPCNNGHYQFWNIKSKKVEHIYIENDEISDPERELSRFHLSSNKKWLVLPNFNFQSARVFKFSDLIKVLPAEFAPVVSQNEQFFVIVKDEDLQVFGLNEDQVDSKFRIKSCKSIFIGFILVASRYVVLIYKKKFKVFDLKSGEIVFIQKIDVIQSKEDLEIYDFEDSILYKSKNSVKITNFSNNFNSEILLISKVEKITNLSYLKDLKTLILSYIEIPSIRSPPANSNLLIYDVFTKTIIQTLSPTDSLLIKNTLILLESCSLSFFSLPSQTQIFSLPFSKPPKLSNQCDFIKVLEETSFTLINSQNPSKSLKFSGFQNFQAVFCKISKLWYVLQDGKISRFDQNLEKQEFFREIDKKFQYLAVIDQILVVYNKKMEFFVMSLDENWKEFSFEMMKIEFEEFSFEILAKNRVLMILGQKFYCFVDFRLKSITMIIKVEFRMLLEEKRIFVCKEIHGWVLVLDLETGKFNRFLWRDAKCVSLVGRNTLLIFNELGKVVYMKKMNLDLGDFIFSRY